MTVKRNRHKMYKRPHFWVVVAALIATFALVILFTENPKNERSEIIYNTDENIVSFSLSRNYTREMAEQLMGGDVRHYSSNTDTLITLIDDLNSLWKIEANGKVLNDKQIERYRDAANVVEDYLEAKKNNDYEAWKSKLWPAEKDAQNFTPSFEKPGDLGVISLSINKVEVSDEETQRRKESYAGSDLAQSQGWSDEYLSENMIIVSTQYTVDYNNTRVPYQEGTLTQDFILIRNDKDSSWLIWDATTP